MKTSVYFYSTGLLLIAAMELSASNLVENGSFENGIEPGSYTEHNPGSTAIDNWDITRDEVDYIGSYWQSADGSRNVELDRGGVLQKVNLTPGLPYTISFYVSGNPDAPPQLFEIRSRAGQEYRDFSFDSTGVTYTNMRWTNFSWSFVAQNAQTEIEFYTLSPHPGHGVALDNIVLYQAREDKPEITVEEGYFNLSTTNGYEPEMADCESQPDHGRAIFDEINSILYICGPYGWVEK